MVYHKGQSWDLYSSASVYLPLHTPSHSAGCHMLTDDTTLHTTGKSIVKIKEMLQLCFVRISVWCNTNHMLINPIKTKSVVITTRQKHQLSDLSLRLSLDGQNIENVTEHRQLGLTVDNNFDGKPRSNIYTKAGQKHEQTKNGFLLSQLQHISNIDTRKIFYNAYREPRIDYATVVWYGCGELHLKK